MKQPSCVIALALTLLCSIFSVSQANAQGNEEVRTEFDELEAEFAEQSLRMGSKNPRKANRKLRTETSERILELIEECDDDNLAVEMLNWIVKQNRSNRSYTKAHQITIEQYLDQPGIADIFNERTGKETLQSVLDENEDLEVCTIATYLLALQNADKKAARDSLIKLGMENGHVRYRGIELNLLIKVRVNTLNAELNR